MSARRLTSLSKVRFSPQLWFELGVVSVMLMEVTWFALWYAAFTQVPVSWARIAAVLALVLLGSHYLSRMLHNLDQHLWLGRVIFLLWLVGCLLASLSLLLFPGEEYTPAGLIGQALLGLGQGEHGMRAFWHLLALALLAWRGVSLARRPLSMGYNIGGFRTGTVMFLLYGLAFGGLQQTDALLAFAIFLFIGLIGMSFARIAHLGEERGGRIPSFGFPWITGILLAGLAVVGLSLSAGWLVRGQVAAWLAAAAAGLFMIMALVFYTLLIPILSVIIDLAYRFGQRIFATFDIPPSLATEAIQQVLDTSAENENALKALIDASRGAVMAGVLLLVVALILVGLSWKPWQRRGLAVEEQVEDIGPGKAGPQEPESGPEKKRRSFSVRRLLAAARIRRVYAQLTGLCAALGSPRPPAATPLEYLPAMERLFPGESSALALITGAYLQVRYGETPETEAEVRAVISAWNQVRTHGRRKVAAARRQKEKP